MALNSKKVKRYLFVGASILILILILFGIVWFVVMGGKNSTAEVRERSIRGITYTTNLEMEELSGDLYVYVLVNTDTDEIVFEVEDPGDDKALQEFFGGLDTFIPGEYELILKDSTIRVIVDGMVE